MLIEISDRRKVARQAVLCLPAISHNQDEDGKILVEFYPVDLILKLRFVEQELQGHPYLDLVEIEKKLGVPARLVERLTRSQVSKMRRMLSQGKIVAVSLIETGRPNASGSRTKRPHFYYVTSKEANLSEIEDKWLDAICESGAWLYERMEKETRKVMEDGDV